MSAAVLDASALLTLLRGEKGAARVAERLNGALISTVNYCEVVAHYSRLDASQDDIRAMLSPLPLVLVPVEEPVAFEAGLMRKAGEAIGLSLGDRICLALAKAQDCPALTADKAWKSLAGDLGVKVELIR